MSDTSKAARERYLIFANGKEQSRQWPWGNKLEVELPALEWPRRWDYVGAGRWINYTSSKRMPENPDGKTVGYNHAFSRAEPFVTCYQLPGANPHGDPATLREIERRTFVEGKGPRFPTRLAFLAQADGFSACPPDVRAPCSDAKAFEIEFTHSILCASPEGDMLVVLDGDDGFQPCALFVGSDLTVQSDGIDDGKGALEAAGEVR